MCDRFLDRLRLLPFWVVTVGTVLTYLLWTAPALAQPTYDEFDKPPHNYYSRELKDRFTGFIEKLESGGIELHYGSEKAFVLSVLKALEIPASSQMLVFSTTSLQLRLISPQRPRALYFSEDVYLGYIPGGRIEVISMEPELGAVFYIFDIPKNSQALNIERSKRCMNCHAAEETGYVPGLVMKSVVPGPSGGSLIAFRQNKTGHAIPFNLRFGGWYVTGRHHIQEHWGNLIGSLSNGELARTVIEPGERFDFDDYPSATSDILPQLLHEHQVGFVNRIVEASYRARTYEYADNGRLSAEHARELDQQADGIVRYLLFADEATLPPGGVEGDARFKEDFLQNRRIASNGWSLKDLDLRTRLFAFRCSYMIYSAVFEGLPIPMKERIYRDLAEALSTVGEEFAYLPDSEKRAIRTILTETVPDFTR